MSAKLTSFATFSSDRFPQTREESEDESGQSNEALAEFIRAGLLRRGVSASEIESESWGNYVWLDGFPFRVGIGCHQDDGETRLRAFVAPNEPEVTEGFRTFRTVEVVQPLIDVLASILAEAGATDIEWSDG